MSDITFVSFELLDKYQKKVISYFDLFNTHPNRFYSNMVDIDWINDIVSKMEWIEAHDWLRPIDVNGIFNTPADLQE